MICIYELVCPLSGQVRYVGKTSRSLIVRLSQHLSEARRHVPNIGRRGDWIRFLLKQDLRPIIRLALELDDDADWQKAECDLIAHHRSLGADIINGTEGGDGMSNPTLEWRIAQSERGRGRKQSPETLAKRSAALKGIPHSPELRAAIALGRINGKKRPTLTEEHKAKIGAASRAWERPPKTEEEKARISEGLKRYYASVEKPVIAVEPAAPKPSMRGKWERTPENRAKIAATLQGRPHTPERRANISAAKLGKSNGPRPPQVRAKISAGHRRRQRPDDQGDLPI